MTQETAGQRAARQRPAAARKRPGTGKKWHFAHPEKLERASAELVERFEACIADALEGSPEAATDDVAWIAVHVASLSGRSLTIRVWPMEVGR